MTDISANVDQAIADVWNGDADDGWVEAAPLDAAPVDAAPTYDANGNMIDPSAARRWRSDPTGRRSTPRRDSTSTRSGI